jgi:hypothetical protein
LRVCAGCKQSLPLEAFQLLNNSNPAGGRRYRCTPCENARQREYGARKRAIIARVTGAEVSAGGYLRIPDSFTKETMPPSTQAKVLVVGDIHFPFHNRTWLSWVLELSHALKPDIVVQIGDLYDFLSFSKYPRSLNLMTPEQECNEARAFAEQFWRDVYGAEKAQLMGNHDARAIKRVLEVLPAIEHLVAPGIKDLYQFEGVTTVDDGSEIEVDGVLYQHGHKLMGRHAPHNRQNTVCGHNHKGGLQVFSDSRGCYWELGVGCGIDAAHPAFGYRGQKAVPNIHLGVGWVDWLGPRFIPMP